MEREIWKDIEGYEGIYQVSNYGRVKGLERVVSNFTGRMIVPSRILKPQANHKGYLTVHLSQGAKNNKRIPIHRLVAIAFIPNPDNLPQVNHKNEDKLDNCVDNLEWCTNLYNSRYGTRPQRLGMKARNGACSKTVAQYSKDGKCLVAIYPSVNEVDRMLGFDFRNIGACCRGEKKSAYGYTWKYI